MMDCGIYKIQCSINGKVYIGSSRNITERWYSHRTALRQNKHHSPYLQNTWNKYSKESFSFEKLLICSEENLLMYEGIYMKYFKSLDEKYGFNVRPITSEGNLKMADSTKRKIGQKARDRNCIYFWKGKNRSIIEIVEMENADYDLVRYRIVDAGVPIEDAIALPPTKPAYLLEHNGKTVSVKDIAEMLNVHTRRVLYRIEEGYSVQDMIDRVMSESKKLSLNEFCKLTSIDSLSYTTFKSRIKKGDSLMDAIDKPKRKMDNSWRVKGGCINGYTNKLSTCC